MSPRTLVALSAGFLVAFGPSRPVRAETAREILDEVIRVNRAREPKDAIQTARMIQYRGAEVEFTREIETSTLFYPDDSSKTVTFFLSPLDIKGVGFLAWNDPHLRDQQWLYLPKLHRVRMVGPAVRRQSFQDTVFTYEDLELFQEMPEWTEKDARTDLRRADDPVEGAACAVIELVPLHDDVSYRRFMIWIHRPDATVRKSEFYDRADGGLVKTANFRRFTTVDGLPVANEVELTNVRIGLRTILEVIETRFNQGLDEEVFTPWHMDRVVR